MESLYPVSEEGTSEGLLGEKAHSTEHRGGLREGDSGTTPQLSRGHWEAAAATYPGT